MIVKYLSQDMLHDKPCEFKGQSVGYLTAVAWLREKASNKELLLLCQCKCGNRAKIRGSLFKQKKVQSCGCLRTEKKKEEKYKRWLPELKEKVIVNDKEMYFFQFIQQVKLSLDEIVNKKKKAYSWSKIYNDRINEFKGIKKKKKKKYKLKKQSGD